MENANDYNGINGLNVIGILNKNDSFLELKVGAFHSMIVYEERQHTSSH